MLLVQQQHGYRARRTGSRCSIVHWKHPQRQGFARARASGITGRGSHCDIPFFLLIPAENIQRTTLQTGRGYGKSIGSFIVGLRVSLLSIVRFVSSGARDLKAEDPSPPQCVTRLHVRNSPRDEDNCPAKKPLRIVVCLQYEAKQAITLLDKALFHHVSGPLAKRCRFGVERDLTKGTNTAVEHAVCSLCGT